jgi:putative Holliday junction resolvase
MVSRFLGIDFGLKRIGLAISDPLGITAQPLELLVRTKLDADVARILAIIEEYEVVKIVIGLPLNMDGSEGFMVESTRAFAAEIKKLSPIEIVEIDERLTSHQASHSLRLSSTKGKKKKERIDCISAQIILRTHMDSLGN